MVRKKLLAKGLNTLLVILLIMISYSFFPHENELKDYILATFISFSVIAFFPVLTIGDSIGYAVLGLRSRQIIPQLLKYVVLYICYSLPTQFLQLILRESYGFLVFCSVIVLIIVLSFESVVLIVLSRGENDCLDYIFGIEYGNKSYSQKPWIKGTLWLMCFFPFMVSFTVLTYRFEIWDSAIIALENDNPSLENRINFEWDQSGLCNSINIIKENTQDIIMPSSLDSYIKNDKQFVWTVYISCDKNSLGNYNKRVAIIEAICESLMLNQFYAEDIPEYYRFRLYYSDYTTPFSTESICYEYYLNRDMTRLSGGIDIKAVLDFNKKIHRNYSRLIEDVLSNSQCDSLLNLFNSNKPICLTEEIERDIICQAYKYCGETPHEISFPIVNPKDVEPIRSKAITFSFPRTYLSVSDLTSTTEKRELNYYRGREMPYSFYYLAETNILSSFDD